MLEHPCLWLSATTDSSPFAPGAASRVRAVLDAESLELLGHLTFAGSKWWWGRGSRRFTAFESPDAALVFRARLVGWFRRTTVVEDADGHLVAIVRGDDLLSRSGGFVARHQRTGAAGRLVGPTGDVLAEWRADGVGTRVCFRPPIFGEPFAKMGVLAVILTS
jgi:hypothetical protein